MIISYLYQLVLDGGRYSCFSLKRETITYSFLPEE